jgi:hypothetical protein
MTVKAELDAAQTGIEKAESRLERARRARQRLSEAQASNKAGFTSSDIVAELDVNDRIDAAEQALAREKSALGLAKSKREILDKYTRLKTIKSLSVDVEATRADELAKKSSRELQMSKARKLERQIVECKIVAPATGAVVYANDPVRAAMRPFPQIEEGATVRERQKILSVIDLNGPKRVSAAVEESNIRKITRNMKARIRVDAFANRLFDGTVGQVNALPNVRLPNQGDARFYTTKIKLEDGIPGLRPGMTAQVEILVDNRDNVLSVPVQAVVRYEGKDHLAIKKLDGGIELRDVRLGISNDKFVEITEGLAGGDTVVMNPDSLMSEPEKGDKLGSPPEAKPHR